ncbi:hypothetical protein [Alkalicoccus urumqiensis]|uniref:CobQ/CobB/MinD/ParA nucleotide binding domain-containing protein n=1 Tax=Alkalicoccus urumqiensis TaxID=1548213 RepID=A0A2P6MER7_ALKUR|nr:hypothetical protein [Alkalicoccus urumqiensis]PRO64805.1 hypothetical protein C6I21_12915 [Alkalicoccus urumqiensis]
MIQMIGISSAHSGAGGSTASRNIASALASAGYRTLLVRETPVPVDVSIQEWDQKHPLLTLFGACGDAHYVRSWAERRKASFVIIDMDPVLESGWSGVLDDVVIVTAPDDPSLTEADRQYGTWESFKKPYLLLNKLDSEEDGEKELFLEAAYPGCFLGSVLYDSSFPFEEKDISLFAGEENGQRYRHIARQLKDGRIRPFFAVYKKKPSLLSRVLLRA